MACPSSLPRALATAAPIAPTSATTCTSVAVSVRRLTSMAIAAKASMASRNTPVANNATPRSRRPRLRILWISPRGRYPSWRPRNAWPRRLEWIVFRTNLFVGERTAVGRKRQLHTRLDGGDEMRRHGDDQLGQLVGVRGVAEEHPDGRDVLEVRN